MSKKGVSAEEKCSRMLQLFYEKGECFQLKELEKIAPKEKGIISNSVKDVIQKLVDDGMIDTDKIGSSVYFWAFPSKALNTRKRKLCELENNVEQSTKKLKVMEQTLQQFKENVNDEKGRDKILEEINDLELALGEASRTLKNYEENDPAKFEQMTKNINGLKEAANRWTDNIFAIKSWCKKKFALDEKIINKQLGIPGDFDYVE